MTAWNREFHQTVSFFMRECGASASLVIDDGTGTYVDGEYTPNILTISCRVIPFDYLRKTEGAGVDYNTLVMSGDKQVFVQPQENLQTINPATTKIVLNGVICKIVTVKSLNPSMNDNVLFELYARADVPL